MLRPTTLSLFRSFKQPLHHSTRNFSSIRPNVFNSPTRSPLAAFVAKNARTIFTDSSAVVVRPTQAEAWKKFAISAATVAGTVVAVNVFFNRETRDGLTAAEQSYLNDSFKYTGGGLAITAIAARSLFKSGFALRVMSANPWLVLGVSLVGSIGTMMGAMYTPPENTILKHAFWLGFNACQAATLSPLFFVAPAILSRAALYTCGVVGALSYVGATAKSDQFLYMGGPLLAGVAVVALSSLAPMALPLGMRGLAITEAVSLYGGLAVFGGFVLYDTQKILHHARLVQTGAMARDPLKESIGLELDMINIFVRLVQILSMQQRKK
ncbi:Bax inhibitor family protein [Cristinia sonorae]|uniref:Bax inhibitor family protein n=1 Tax=Cristinia sonorae TaxID=1940300 RepID=A0A8K0UKQ2_9AGAR|nr:Bax inhibitor family protein [Cristinia sonorae]